MSQGLTDRETLHVIMTESREHRREIARVKELAAKGAGQPGQLTPDETRELCESVLRSIGRWEAR